MKSHYRKKRTSRRFILRPRDRWLIAAALILVLACVADWIVSQRQSRASSPHFRPPAGDKFEIENGTRARNGRQLSGQTIYPYSVIPGGVQSVQELKTAIARDPVVAAQFASFHLERARVVHLDSQRSMHVSYRLGERIYWTKRTLTLSKGETVITDGALTARTRCGNLVAQNVAGPVSPAEPTPEKLNTPETRPELESDNRFPPLEPPKGPGLPNPPTGSSSGGGTPPIGFAPGPPIPFPVPQPPPNPVVNVPEPSTALLLLAASLSLALALRLKPFFASRRWK